MVAQQRRVHPDFSREVELCAGPELGARIDEGVGTALRADVPVLAVVPAERAEQLSKISSGSPGLKLVTVEEGGHNPATVLSAAVELARSAAPGSCRIVVQLLWAGRAKAERQEVARCELLIPAALSTYPAAVLSVYEAEEFETLHTDFGLDLETLDAAARELPPDILGEGKWPLDSHGGAIVADEVIAADRLSDIRHEMGRVAGRLGLGLDRGDDLVMVVNELASNSVLHAGGRGALCVWATPEAVFCEVSDPGLIDNPLIGCDPPGPTTDAKGLWLVNQLCDLVQVRSSGEDGTKVRVRIDR